MFVWTPLTPSLDTTFRPPYVPPPGTKYRYWLVMSTPSDPSAPSLPGSPGSPLRSSVENTTSPSPMQKLETLSEAVPSSLITRAPFRFTPTPARTLNDAPLLMVTLPSAAMSRLFTAMLRLPSSSSL